MSLKSTYPFRVIYLILFVALMQILNSSCVSEKSPDGVDSVYTKEISEWHNKRIARLKSETGWLNLTGLFWLKEGKNSFGSGSANNIIFPGENVPERIGSFTLNDGDVFLDVEPQVEVFVGDSAVNSTKLINTSNNNSNVLSLNTLRFFVIKRGNKTGIRLRDLEAPLVKDFESIERFPVDKSWQIEAVFKRYENPIEISIPTVLGTIEKDTSFGRLEFVIENQQYHIDPIFSGDKLFIIFADLTNGIETYGGGRFLYSDAPDSTGKTILDFNKAYNPPCAFTRFATCPLPPKENQLRVEIKAGEKIYSSSNGH